MVQSLIIRKAVVEDAASLVAAEQETARTPGLLVSRSHELTRAAFEQKIVELGASGLTSSRRKMASLLAMLYWTRCHSKRSLMYFDSRSSSIQIIWARESAQRSCAICWLGRSKLHGLARSSCSCAPPTHARFTSTRSSDSSKKAVSETACVYLMGVLSTIWRWRGFLTNRRSVRISERSNRQ